MFKAIQRTIERVSRAIAQPRSELNHWQRSARYIYELSRYGAHQLREDRATEMAAALTFRTLFALLPVLLVTTILVRALAGQEKVKEWVGQGIQGVGISDIRLQVPTDELVPPPVGGVSKEESKKAEDVTDPDQQESGNENSDQEKSEQGRGDVESDTEKEESLSPQPQDPGDTENPAKVPLPGKTGTLGDFVENLVDAAAKLDLNTMSLVGLLVVLYSALSLMVTIEESFNAIFRAPSGRSWVRRIPLYWTVLTLSPIMIGGMVYLNRLLVEWGAFVDAQAWLAVVQVFASLITTWLFFAAVYLFVPNTRVSVRAALTGALVAATLFEILKRSLSVYFEHAFALSRLYSSLGLVPLMMFWLYLMWLVFLFGVEVSSAVQRFGRRLNEGEHSATDSGLVDTSSIIDLICRVAQSFSRGNASSLDDISEESGMNKISVTKIADALVKAGIFHRVADQEASVCLARSPSSLAIADLLRASYRIIDGGKPTPKLTSTLRDRQLESTGSMTLESWLTPKPVSFEESSG